MTTLTQRTTWTVNPNLEVVAQWIDEDDCDTYADRIEAYTIKMADNFEIDEDNVAQYAKVLTDWIYNNDPDLAELHAQWNEYETDEDIKESFFTGVLETLEGSAHLV